MFQHDKVCDMGKDNQGWREQKQVLVAVTGVRCEGLWHWTPNSCQRAEAKKKSWYHTPPNLTSLTEVV